MFCVTLAERDSIGVTYIRLRGCEMEREVLQMTVDTCIARINDMNSELGMVRAERVIREGLVQAHMDRVNELKEENQFLRRKLNGIAVGGIGIGVIGLILLLR